MAIEITSWKQFCDITIEIDDLDPTYIMIKRGKEKWGQEWAERFCLHMLMFYDLQGASVAAHIEGEKFWEYVQDNYPTCTRGKERRHFRGENGRKAIASLIEAGNSLPEGLLTRFYAGSYPTVVRTLGKTLSGFGPYFAWKWADYLDRIFDLPVDYSQAYPFMHDSPLKCALTLWPHQSPEQTLKLVADYIAPHEAPGGGRGCGIAEAETALCVMKAYFISGRGRIGDGIEEKHHQLKSDPYGIAAMLPPRVDMNRWKLSPNWSMDHA